MFRPRVLWLIVSSLVDYEPMESRAVMIVQHLANIDELNGTLRMGKDSCWPRLTMEFSQLDGRHSVRLMYDGQVH